MSGDERVGPFRGGRETGNTTVESKPESSAGRVAEREETGLSRADATPVGGNELHRALEIGFRNGGIFSRDLLIRPVCDLLAGQRVPITRPINAEPAIAVIDEPRAQARGWGIRVMISGILWHNIRDD